MPSFSTSTLLILLGFVPSLVWLVYYFKKDCHPEPKAMIAKTLLMGILTAPLAVIAQLVFSKVMEKVVVNYDISGSVIFFLWAAFIEEYVKFLGVKYTVLNNPAFDEPTDAMVYMISSALGFAAIENTLVLFNAIPNGVGAAFQIWSLRFAGATLLHAVSSGILGYFLGLSWFYWRHSRKLIVWGMFFATFAHFVFNITLLATNSQPNGFFISTFSLIILAILISFLFTKLKNRMAHQIS